MMETLSIVIPVSNSLRLADSIFNFIIKPWYFSHHNLCYRNSWIGLLSIHLTNKYMPLFHTFLQISLSTNFITHKGCRQFKALEINWRWSAYIQSFNLIKMMTIEGRLRNVLNRVNNQINSHTIIIQPRGTFDFA